MSQTEVTRGPTTSPVPRKLNQGMIDALSKAIAKGNYAVTACQLVGISEPAFYGWIGQGVKDEENGKTETESLYLSLVKSLKRADAKAETKMVDLIINTAVEKKDGYLGMTYLERRHPERWGRKDRARIDITEKRAITITHVEVVLNQGDGKQVIEGESREITDGED